MTQFSGPTTALRGQAGADLMHPWRLEFLDEEREAGFRAAERDRNLRQARFGLGLALALNLAFGALDPLVYAENLPLVLLMRLAVVTPLLAVLISLTFTAYYRTRWPGLLVAAEWIFAICYGAVSALAAPPEAVLTGFTLVILGAYLLFPLIFQYGAFAAWTTTLIYVAMIALIGGRDGETLMILAAQLITANIIGMFALYRSERFRRLDHLNTLRLADERERYHDLLTRILPTPVAERLERGETVVDEVADASVLFADIVGFTEMASRLPASDTVALLNHLFSDYDDLVARHGLEKIKTIGDAYMVAGGVPRPRADHLQSMAALALDMCAAAAARRRPDGAPIEVRIGLHSGQVLAGVIGETRFLYDLWGDTVNTASRMERLGETGRIQVSDNIYRRLQDEFLFEPRGDIEVKGKGRMPVWYLTGRRRPHEHDGPVAGPEAVQSKD